MLPDEASDAGVFTKGLVGAVGLLVVRVGSLDGNVVNKRYSDVRNFGSQNVGDVLVKNRNGVSPTHRESDKTKRAERLWFQKNHFLYSREICGHL